ncbi:MAG TPA: NAD(P)-binding protein [Syntrophales bacterium]|nr:NAD(P)-binding protein [Syntrophales bacterium]
MDTKHVVVIGSGVGGSAVGALLANTGCFNVTLVEKSHWIGGRFATQARERYFP